MQFSWDRFSLKARSYFFVGLIVSTILGSALLNHLVRRDLEESLHTSVLMTTAVHNHGNIDMIHDGLRGVVLTALTQTELGVPADQVTRELDAMSAEIKTLVANNKALPLPDSISRALASVDEPLAAYVAAANEIVHLTATDRSAAMARMAQFTARFEALEEALGTIGTEITKHAQEVEAQSSELTTRAAMFEIATLLLSICGTLAIAGFLVLSVLRPLIQIRSDMSLLSKGETNFTIAGETRADEIGEMARALEVFRKNTQERVTLLAEIEQSRQAAETRKVEIEGLALRFLTSADQLKAVLDRQAHIVSRCAIDLGSSVETTVTETSTGLAASTDASHNVQTVAAAAEQLSASTRRISEQANVALTITAKASDASEQANQDIANLTAVTEKIGGILEVIRGIAAQTNLLSLNATIEAARAGEAGKGFAVVASEVKALADQTTKATNEVAQLVSAIGGSMTAAVSSIGEISSQIAEVNSISSEIANAVSEQNLATSEIAESASRAASSTAGARETSAKISDVVSHSRAHVGRVENAASSLFLALRDFTNQIDGFLGTISTDFKERRRAIRHDVACDLTVLVNGRTLTAKLQSISVDGARLSGLTGIPSGSRVTLNFPDAPVGGRVVWVEGSTFSVAFDATLNEIPIRLDMGRAA